MAELEGKRIIVTGAATGIGRATALLVGARGAAVAAFDVNDRDGEAAVAGIEAGGGRGRYWHVDVACEAEVAAGVEAAAAWMGGLDVLLHIAGVIEGVMADIADVDEAIWDRVLDVNLKGSFLMAKHAALAMRRSGGGVIVLTASGAGVTGGSAAIPYAPSKGGVHGLAMVLERHLAADGIRVVDVCPGKVETPLVTAGREEYFRRTGRRPEPAPADGSGSPFLYEGHLSPPEAIAEAYAFLASDRASHVRGSIFTR